MLFSPDGETLATAGWDKIVRFWDAGTGELLYDVNVADVDPENDGDLRMYTVCFAPRGGLIATAHLQGEVRVWNAADMTLRTKFQVEGRLSYGAMSFSPDGSWLATGSASGEVAVWDPLTGEKMWDVGRHQSHVYTVSFGRDSRSLLSGGDDGVGYLWDLRPSENQPGKDLSRIWSEMAGEDGPAAYRAMCALIEIPDRAVSLLAKNVRAGSPSIDGDRVRKWIVDLDSSDVATRDAARASLARIGSVAVEPLREALTKATSPERNQFLKKLLAKVQTTERAERRGVSLLAKLDTPKARLLLKGWASRDPSGALGRSAAAALRQSEQN